MSSPPLSSTPPRPSHFYLVFLMYWWILQGFNKRKDVLIHSLGCISRASQKSIQLKLSLWRRVLKATMIRHPSQEKDLKSFELSKDNLKMPVSVWGYKCSCKEHQQRIKDFNNPIEDYELVSGVKRQGYRTRYFPNQVEGTIHWKSYPTDYILANFLLRKVQKVHEDFLLCRVSEEISFPIYLFLQTTSRFYCGRSSSSSQVHSICIFYYLCLVYKDIFISQHLFLEADCKVQSFIFSHS